MSDPVYKTKGELRADLLIRLGYGGLGAAAGGFVPMADSLLEEAQEQIYLLLPAQEKTREWTFTTGVGQRWYDIPTTCDIGSLTNEAFSVYYGERWIPMHKGIDRYHDSIYTQSNYYPQRWDVRYNESASKAQIEVWPEPDAAYSFKCEGRMQLGAFAADGDRASVDDRLVLMYAIAYGKSHLNRPDADKVMNALNLRLNKLRAKQHAGIKYIREEAKPEPLPIPRVV